MLPGDGLGGRVRRRISGCHLLGDRRGMRWGPARVAVDTLSTGQDRRGWGEVDWYVQGSEASEEEGVQEAMRWGGACARWLLILTVLDGKG